MDFLDVNRERKPKGKRYPWSLWFSKDLFTLRRGKHFECQAHGMMQTIRQAAKRAGIKVSVQVADSSIRVQVLSRGGKSDA